MITSTVRSFDYFAEFTDEIEARTLAALEEAAGAARSVADERAQGISTFSVVEPHRVAEGWASGISGANKKWRIFDKGSLGKRTAKLKRDRRKDSWPVSRRGSTYEAHRRDVTGKGIAARNISNPARLAGRKKLLSGIRGR